MNILIITGGHIQKDFALDFLKKHCFDQVIAVDGGLRFAHLAAEVMKQENRLLALTHIVGDFDTISPDILVQYTHRPDVVIHRFNPEKDNTDTDIALRLAIEMCREDKGCITILGATGSRLDHVLANVTMLRLPFESGIQAWIVDGNNRISILSGTLSLKKERQYGHYISLIPLTEEIRGVTLKGVKYPLENHTVRLGESLCVSNEITDTEATLTVKDGMALLLETKD